MPEVEADTVSLENDETANAEITKVWYDSNWIETPYPSAYYRLGSRDSLNRWQGPVRDYYADGVIQMKGAYTNDRKDGIFLYYSHHNTYTSAGRYVNNKSVGRWQTFHENGKLESDIYYRNNYFLKDLWTADGEHVVSNGSGKLVEYYPNGVVKLEGEYRKGNKHGRWIGHFQNGLINYVEEFNYGLLVEGRSRNEKGASYIYDESSLYPQPSKGFPAFYNYVKQEIAKVSIGHMEAVKLTFRVTAQGRITDIEPTENVSKTAEEKARQILLNGPKWQPARLHGYIPVDGFGYVVVEFDQ
jgi:antitoxin component YwqK of YwqJK toxin-antitoxin module